MQSIADFLKWVCYVVSINRVDLFYNSRTWRRKRKEILAAAHYDCALCKAHGKASPATVAHHIKTLRSAPMLALTDSNLMAVCDKCHYKIHHPEEKKNQWDDEKW